MPSKFAVLCALAHRVVYIPELGPAPAGLLIPANSASPLAPAGAVAFGAACNDQALNFRSAMIVPPKTKAFRNGAYRFLGILYQECISHDLTLHARGLILQLAS